MIFFFDLMKSKKRSEELCPEIYEEDQCVTGTIFSSSANLANTMIGTGMLAMPFAFSQLGIAQGLVMVSITGILAAAGLILLSKSAQVLESRCVSFNALAKVSYPAAAVIMDTAIAITCFGTSVSYLIVGLLLV